MSKSQEYRINGFRQIEAFYSLVFSGKHDFSPQHISLYMFLLNQNNRSNWIEWFKCPYDLAMNGAMIGSKKTYYACLTDLKEWGLIKYIAGENQFKAPKISLSRLDNEPQLIPQCEPAQHLNSTSTDTCIIPAPAPLPTTARVRYINYITSNLNNLITNNLKQLEFFDFDFDKVFLITVIGDNEETGGSKMNLPETPLEMVKRKWVAADLFYSESDSKDLREVCEKILVIKDLSQITGDQFSELDTTFTGIIKFIKSDANAKYYGSFKAINTHLSKIVNGIKNGKSNNSNEQISPLREAARNVLNATGFKS